MRQSNRLAAKAAQAVTVTVKPTTRKRSASTQSTETSPKRVKVQSSDARLADTTPGADTSKADDRLAERKWQAWSTHATTTPFPNFGHPTHQECRAAHAILKEKHQAAVDKEFADPNTPETIHHVLDAMVVAILSQATSWSNAKRAMNSMKAVYGSVFEYNAIWTGGVEKLQETLRCGGLHVRKSKLIMAILEQVKARHGECNLDHLFQKGDEDAMQELISYKGMGPKSASVVMGWCLKRNPFTVDTHVYRLAGIWGWRPKEASREKTQSHLEVMVPKKLKFDLHFLMIAHGRVCPRCRGGSKDGHSCDVLDAMKASK